MDERKIKRLLTLLAMAIIAIFVAKYLLTEAATNLGKASARKPPAVAQPAPEAASAPPAIEPLAELPASAVEEAGAVASATSEAEPAPVLR